MTALPRFLTRLDTKADLFVRDPYFRRAWCQASACWGEAGGAVRLHDIGNLILKPEAALSAKLTRGIELIADSGCVPLWAKPIRFSRRIVGAEWRYQINKATPERRRAMEQVLQSAEGLFVLFRRPPAALAPSVIDMSILKGPSDPAARARWHLRRQISDVQDPMVNFLHAPDEPADMIRQWGIMFDARERRDILTAIETGRAMDWGALDAMALAMAARTPHVSFDLHGALGRIADAAAIAVPSAAVRKSATRRIEFLAKGDRGHWPTLARWLAAHAVDVSQNDAFTVAALTPVMHRPGASAILEGDVAPLWTMQDQKSRVCRHRRKPREPHDG